MSEPASPHVEISVVRVFKERGVNFAAGTYSVVFLTNIRTRIGRAESDERRSGLGALWRRLQRVSAEEWVFTAIRGAFVAEASARTVESDALRAPPEELSQYSVPKEDRFALTLSFDGTRGGMQFGQQAFSFSRGALAGFAIELPALDGAYVLSVLFAPPSPDQPPRRASLVIPVPTSVDTSLELLTFAIQLAGFFETPLEYADHGGDGRQRVKN